MRPIRPLTPRQRALRNLWLRACLLLTIMLVTMTTLSQIANAGRQLVPFGERGLAKPPQEGVVNINEATAHQLSFLPGIGLKKAERIVEYRLRRPFTLIGHLARVKGIGRKTVRALRPFLRLTGRTTMTRPAKKPRSRR